MEIKKNSALVWGKEGYGVVIRGYLLWTPDLMFFFLGFFVRSSIPAFIRSSNVYRT